MKRNERPPVVTTKPVWSLRNLTYSLDDVWSNSQNTTIELDLETIETEVFAQNKTMYLHARVYADSPLHQNPKSHPRYQQLVELMPQLL